MTDTMIYGRAMLDRWRTPVTEALAVGVLFTGLSYLIALAAGWITEVNYLELFAVFTSYGSTYLCVVQKRLNYVFGAISTLAYGILFLQSGLVASMLLNFYLAPALVYGWFRWKSDADTRPVRHVELKWVPVYLILTVTFYAGAVALSTAFGGAFAPLDSVILIGTILAQFLLDNKRIETWMVWAVVNVAAIYLYFTSGLPLAGVQYVFFLLNTVYAYFQWRKTLIK